MKKKVASELLQLSMNVEQVRYGDYSSRNRSHGRKTLDNYTGISGTESSERCRGHDSPRAFVILLCLVRVGLSLCHSGFTKFAQIMSLAIHLGMMNEYMCSDQVSLPITPRCSSLRMTGGEPRPAPATVLAVPLAGAPVISPVISLYAQWRLLL
jgi:hypothetical protein